MKRYLYNYQTIVTFSEPVSAHAVMLRCQPAANAFQTIEQEHIRTSKFRMQDLPTEVARAVEGLAVGEISKPFEMINSKGKNVCAIIKLKSRTESHRATITEDFQTMKDVVLAKRREQALNDWVAEKLKNTYVRMNDQYRGCEFQYKGWVK